MAKITLMDTMMDIITKMAEGNPGACNCLLSILSKKDWFGNIDPIMMILMFDEIGIYGEKIYMLWSDCCDKDLVKLELVLRNYQMGHISKETVIQHVSKGRGTPFTDLLSIEALFAKRV